MAEIERTMRRGVAAQAAGASPPPPKHKDLEDPQDPPVTDRPFGVVNNP
jgi:hypothetical protein